jgi:hypothetical protein
MFVKGYCKKCHGTPIFDIGDSTKEDVEKWLNTTMFGHCAVGWHVELGKMANNYSIDWNTLTKNKEDLEIERGV